MPSLTLPLAALALAQGTATAPKTEPKIVQPTITGVSMFKNGYAFITREIPLTGTTADVIEVPQASVGTLWFTTDTGTLDTITSALDLQETRVTNPLDGFGEILRANLGKTVTVYLREPKGDVSEHKGTIAAVGLQTFILEAGGNRSILPLNMIHAVRGDGPDFKISKTDMLTGERRYYRIATTGGAKRVMMMSLERGLTWAPAYAMDITDPKELTFVARSTVLNDVFDLREVDAKLITGFPNLPFSAILDPISANMSIDQWLGLLGGGPVAKGGVGGAFARREMMTQNAAAPMSPAADVDWGGVPEAAGNGESLGDLFFYNIPKLTLAKGARQSRNLFRFSSPYEHVYTWDLPAEYDPYNFQFRPIPREADEVWHTISFVNTSSQPLTTAVATVIQKGQLVGQSQLNYIAPSGKAEVRIGKALDIAPERLEEETARERGAIKDRSGNPIFDLLTVKGTLVLTNRRKEAAKIRVTKEVVGEIFETSPTAKVTKSPGGLGQQNTTAKAVWTPTVPAGEKVTLTYSYRVYVRSNG